MLNITHAEASQRITAFASEGRLIQNNWHSKSDDGRELACILGSMHPSVKRPSDCNGKLMPMWMAELTPVLFDKLPSDQIVPIALRYGSLIGRWHVLKDEDWSALLTAFLVRTIDDALESARPANVGKPYWEQVETACKQCVVAIQSGDKKAACAAADAARAAAYAADAADAADAAAYAADAAAYAADAADAAAYAADAADAARAAAYAARAAVDAATRATYAADATTRLFTYLLDEIEKCVVVKEQAP